MMENVFDNAHARTEIVGRAQSRAQNEDQASGNEDAHVRIGEKATVEMFGVVQQKAEQDADAAQKRGQCDHFEEHDGVHRRHGGDGEGFRGNFQKIGHKMCDHRGGYARHQRGIVHDADADDFHGEDGGCKRCAEKRGKTGAHAAHDDQMLIICIQFQRLADAIGDAAAQLNGRAFASGRTAEEMRDDRRNKNQRSHAKGNVRGGLNGRNHHVCSLVGCVFEKTIQKYDGQTAERKTERNPWIGGAQVVYGNQRMTETGGNCADNDADAAGNHKPFQHGMDGKETAGEPKLYFLPNCFLRHKSDFRFIINLERLSL